MESKLIFYRQNSTNKQSVFNIIMKLFHLELNYQQICYHRFVILLLVREYSDDEFSKFSFQRKYSFWSPLSEKNWFVEIGSVRA